MTLGIVARQIGDVTYILLGYSLSAIMFQLSVSLSLILNIIDLEEANQRKITYNICITVISVVYIVLASVEYKLDDIHGYEHLVFEAIGLIILFLIYFSTIVDLIRKLRIFLLEETKLEGRLIRIQFLIFFIAYGSKIITLMVWIKRPLYERRDVEGFLINTDVMSVIWVTIPITFVLWMQTRSFIKMRAEKIQLLLDC